MATLAQQAQAAAASSKANYTAEQENMMHAEYSASPTKETVEKLAVKLGKTSRSIVAKLSRMGIYQKAERVSKSGQPVQAKNELADAIGAVLRLSEGEITSLVGANKTALQKIFNALANSVPLPDPVRPDVSEDTGGDNTGGEA